MKLIMRGSSSTTRMRLPSRGLRLGSFVVMVISLLSLVTEGQREFDLVFCGRQYLDEV